MSQERKEEWEARKTRLTEKLEKAQRDRGHYINYLEQAALVRQNQSAQLLAMQQQDISGYSEQERAQHQVNIDSKGHEIDSLDRNISGAQEGLADLESRIAWYQSAIEIAVNTIERIESEIEEAQALAQQAVSEEAESQCPKKCTISNIQLRWPEATGAANVTDEAKSVEVQAYTGTMPTFDVIGSSVTNSNRLKIMSVAFAGTCEHGRAQSAADSATWKESKRYDGDTDYCPKVFIHSKDQDTLVIRPSKVLFNAQVPGSEISENKLGYLFKRLVFGKDFDTSEYYLDFYTCTGQLPEQAVVIAHPYRAWNVKASAGFVSATDVTTTQDENKSFLTYDDMETKGKWAATIDYGFSYDKGKDNQTLDLEFNEFIKHLQGQWPFLEHVTKFLDPVLGFLDDANNRAKGAAQNAPLSPAEKHKIASVEIQTPKIFIEGKYENKEFSNFTVGGEGSLTIGFDPLLGIKGEVDIIQMLLATAGGVFGEFLRQICNMSLGKKDANGKLTKKGNYFETALSLKLGAESSVSGKIGWLCNKEKGWHRENRGTAGGKVVFSLKGDVAGNGRLWRISFGIGASVELASALGDGAPGFQLDYSAVYTSGNYKPEVELMFNGLSIIWTTYQNFGIEEGEGDKDEGKADDTDMFGSPQNVDSSPKLKSINKDSGQYVFFKKKTLWKNS